MPKVLTIDDSRTLRVIVRHALSPHGMEVIEAESGAQGLEKAGLERPDAILLDLNLPDLSGKETLLRLREDPATAAIPVIILTCEAAPETVVDLVKMGLGGYVVKPFQTADLVGKLRRAMATAGATGTQPAAPAGATGMQPAAPAGATGMQPAAPAGTATRESKRKSSARARNDVLVDDIDDGGDDDGDTQGVHSAQGARAPGDPRDAADGAAATATAPTAAAADPARAASGDPSPARPAAGGRPVVLAVDDTPNVLDLLEEYLAEGIEFVRASSGLEAVNLIRRRPPDAVLLDLDMPGATGADVFLETADVLKSHGSLVWGMSPSSREDQIAGARRAGIRKFLAKPFDESELAEIAAAIRQRSASP